MHQAIEQYQRVIALTDNAAHPSPWVRSTTFARMGSAYRALGDWSQAKESFRRALEINPKDGSSWIALGIVNQLSGDLPGAVQAYSRGVQIQPSDVGYLLLARALEENGNHSGAETARRQAQAISSNLSRAEASVDVVFAHPTGAADSAHARNGPR